MAEIKEYATHPDERGSINISQEVIASIAANAALECEGVDALTNAQGKEKLQGRSVQRSVKIEMGDDGVKADVYVMVRLGYSVNDVGRAVQKAVGSAVESSTGLKMSCVDVHICGLSAKQ